MKKPWVYNCVACKEDITTTSASKSYICRPCLARSNAKKANQAAVKVRTLEPYLALYRVFLSVNRNRKSLIKLSFKSFKSFTNIDTCFYCESKVEWAKKSTKGYMVYNLDRKDNSKPYTKSNCVVCCGKCNRIKMNHFNAEEFIEVVKLIKNIRGSW